MRRRMMKSKIHRMTVTDANVDYIGSITLDPDLLARADIREWEQVAVVDVDNGARFETYVILGEPGRGACCLNGAAARLVHPGDKVIIITYADYDDAELERYVPTIVHVDDRNSAITEAAALLKAVTNSAEEAPAARRQRQGFSPGPDEWTPWVTRTWPTSSSPS